MYKNLKANQYKNHQNDLFKTLYHFSKFKLRYKYVTVVIYRQLINYFTFSEY